MQLNHIPNRIFYKNGEEFLYFGGTNYLGVNTLPDFQALLFSGFQKWGSNYGSSRSANIQLEIYKIAEDLLAKQLETEAVVTVSSGMLAGKLVLELLHKTNDVIFHFPNTHPALLHPSSLPLLINKELNPVLFTAEFSKIGIVADAIPSLEVTPINLDILKQIPIEKEVTLILDETYSIGILGEKGQGILNHFELPNIQQKISIASFGKALGLSGGFIAGNLNFITEIKKQQNFIGASGMNPAFLETYVNAQNIYESQRRKLNTNLSIITKILIPNTAFTFASNYPVIYFDNDELLEQLTENNIVPTSFSYPTTSGKLSRIVISAHHTSEDLHKIIKQLNIFTSISSEVAGDSRFIL